MKKKRRIAIMGGSESGKTFLGMGFVRAYWKKHGLRALVFDPWKGEVDWGPSAFVVNDFEDWKHMATHTKGMVLVWDETTANGGRDRDNLKLLSEVRHNHPVMVVMGHTYASLLPGMRVNLTDVFLALSDPDEADQWAKVMKDPEIKEKAVDLLQYEFLHKRNFEPLRVVAESENRILAGEVLP
jgi:hypothetical protein